MTPLQDWAPEAGSPEPLTLHDFEAQARQLLDPGIWAYFQGAAADEYTLAANTRAWSDITLWPRVLRTTAGGHTRTTLLGRELQHPVLVAPMAYQALAHPDGEHATTFAAAALGAGMVLSTQATARLEHIADIAHRDPDRGPLWFQLYLQHDRGFTRELVQRAEQAGFEALVLTVDAPCQGVRDRERRARFKLPAGIAAINLREMQPLPAAELRAHQSPLFDDLLYQAATWADVHWLKSITRLPVLLKGVLHPQDAREAVARGVEGLVVSNHGGRTLDTSPATARALPRIVEAVDAAVPVLVDGGIRRGTDILKAIALGANAVLVGRPILHGLTRGGATGVAQILRLLRDELEIAMALCGCRTLADASPALLTAGSVGERAGH